MRYLGIDYGTKRIGLALSDPEGRLAFPGRTVSSLAEVIAAVHRGNVQAVVIGLPRDRCGRDTQTALAARAFARELAESVQLPVTFEDEAFTTKIARQSSPEEKADAAAAALMLQSYLDKQNANGKDQKSK